MRKSYELFIDIALIKLTEATFEATRFWDTACFSKIYS